MAVIAASKIAPSWGWEARYSHTSVPWTERNASRPHAVQQGAPACQ